MEKILQSIVKIIIVGVLYNAKVFCSRSFLPPLPYYQNDPYYIPSFITPYQEYVPVYVQPDVPPPPPPPISYHNSNAYTRHLPPPKTYHPPQLFYKNENYHPLPPPGINYPVTPFPTHPHHYKPVPYTEQKANYEIQQKPTLQETKPQQEQQKGQMYTSNIILKDENYPPYYQDEYNKNHHEDDYYDNYTDDAPVQKDPCIGNSPYRNFEPVPNGGGKYTLCPPYFQPNFGNSVYTVKAPITLLPSRFPPRVEEFVQRIQNYFSTYTEKETPKPDNETSTIAPPANETTTEEQEVVVEDVNTTNITKIQQLEQAPVNQTNDTEKVTIELEFVGKKKEGVTNATEPLTNPTTEQPQQESTMQSQMENTTEPTGENKIEEPVTTPENEVLPEVTDTNG